MADSATFTITITAPCPVTYSANGLNLVLPMLPSIDALHKYEIDGPSQLPIVELFTFDITSTSGSVCDYYKDYNVEVKKKTSADFKLNTSFS